MTTSTIGMLAFGLLLAGCGAESSSPPPSGAQGGSSGETPGCSVAPACGTCDNCFQKCFCETQDNNACVTACSSAGGSSGAGAGGSSGTGTAGTTSTGGSAGTTTGSGGTGSGATGGTDATGGTGNVGTGGSSGTTGTGGTAGVPGAQTYQIQTAQFTLQPGQEAFRCQNFANPFPADVGVVKSESYMTPGSHHMFVFYRDGATNGGIESCSGLEFGTAVHSAQTPEQIITYPAGIGRTVRKSQGLRIMMHYLNTATTPLTAQVTVVFHTVSPTALTHEAGSLFYNNLNINLGAGVQSVTQTCNVPNNINILGAVSHMHKWATNFKSATNTGVTIYEGTDWDEPQPNAFNPALQVAAGTRITTTCTYNNTSGGLLRFGDSAQTDEMCILSGTYYPAPGGQTLHCQ